MPTCDISGLNRAELLVRLYDNAIHSLVAQEYSQPLYQLTIAHAERELSVHNYVAFIDEVCISIDFSETTINVDGYDTLYAGYAESAATIISKLRSDMRTADANVATASDDLTFIIHSSDSDEEENQTAINVSFADEIHEAFSARTPSVNDRTETYREGSPQETTPRPISQPHTTPMSPTTNHSEQKKEEELRKKGCCDTVADCFTSIGNAFGSLFSKKTTAKAAGNLNNLDEPTPAIPSIH